MKLNSIIVDDEPLARSFLERYCERTGFLEVAGSFPDSLSALEYLNANEVKLLFLDVEMPGDSGFRLLDQLSYMPKVILTTSKTDYAFDAFQYHVTDYLKKPITYNRFIEAVNKVIEKEKNSKNETRTDDIFIKSEGKFIRLSFKDILYIESMGDYVKYFTPVKNYLSHSTLKSVEEKMDARQFMKVHRSFIVNLNKIKDIKDHSLVIEGKVIPISKAIKPEVMERINVF